MVTGDWRLVADFDVVNLMHGMDGVPGMEGWWWLVVISDWWCLMIGWWLFGGG